MSKQNTLTRLESQITQMESHQSPLEQELSSIPLQKLSVFEGLSDQEAVVFESTDRQSSIDPEVLKTGFSGLSKRDQSVLKLSQNRIQKSQNKRVAVLFSGGPASGGHNVLFGIHEYLKGNTLLGVQGGPGGLLKGQLFEITDEAILRVKNTGGFDFLGTDRTKIKTKEQFDQVRQVVQKESIDAIIIVGGDDSNTNAAVLAEEL